MNLFQQWKSDSDYHDQNENTIISDNNIEKHCSNENSEEDESPDDVGLLKMKHLEITWHYSVIFNKDLAFMIKASEFWKKTLAKKIVIIRSLWMIKLLLSGPTLESKSMCAIYQKKGKKGQNIWKFGQKCTKFENILKEGRWLYVIITLHKLPK